MSVRATQIVNFIDQHPRCSITKYEVYSPEFASLRKGIRKIVASLTEGDEPDSKDVADGLRVKLSEWLTAPVCFDESFFELLSALGGSKAVQERWGREAGTGYDLAIHAASEIPKAENPVRSKLRETIQELQCGQRQWRIYCHRSASIHFESIFPNEQWPDTLFLHSVTDYRESEPFDVLIKVGPLRSRGWGSAPDAILNAPRFETLTQLVWAGCDDEEDFGYDPIVSRITNRAAQNSREAIAELGSFNTISWSRSVVRYGDAAGNTAPVSELDDLRFFHELRSASTSGSGMRGATLIQIDEHDGVLYPPHSGVLTFNPALNAESSVGYLLPSEILTGKQFILWPLLGAADFGDLRAGEGYYSNIWKERLRQAYRNNLADLLHRLRIEGIELINLSSRLRQWCRPASTVIHAPQQQRHFEILVKVLGIDHDATRINVRGPRRPWWEYAWAEIGRSRGVAIQTGFQEHEIRDEELFAILRDLLPEISLRSGTQSVFQISIPADKPLQGIVRFYRALAIEEGFLVPDTLLKTICDLEDIDQWRV